MISTKISCSIGVFVLITIVLFSESKPTDSNNGTESTDVQPPAKDLKYTFSSADEIPEGFMFMDSVTEQPEFGPCKDGKGGICIPVGQCSSELKRAGRDEKSCDVGEECCLGGPPAGTPCKNRGGECTEASRCGKNSAQLTSGTECNHSKGETCCIWVY